MTGRIHLAAQRLRHCTRTALSNAANPQASVNPILFLLDPAQFHRIGCVNQGNHLAELAAVLNFQQQLFFLRLKRQILAAVAKVSGRHVGTFSADTRNHHDCCICVIRIGSTHCIRVVCHRHFRNENLLRLCTHPAAIGTLVALHAVILLVKIPQHRIDSKHTVCFHCAAQCLDGRGFNTASARSAQNQINR